MRLPPAFLLILALSGIGSGQTYTISTFAGGAAPPNNILGTSSNLYGSPSVASDKAGNIYFPDSDEHVVLRLDATTGILTVVAGNGTGGFSGDNGPATNAQLNQPLGVTLDSAGNLYIADSSNSRIRKVSNGVITTVAGTGTVGFSGDNGPATSAQLFFAFGVAVDASGNLYIADDDNNRIRKVSNGVITTVAVTGVAGFSGDNGPATSAQLNGPAGVALDTSGNLYIADTGNNRIRKVSNGVITTVAGNGIAGFSGDNGPATSAQLNGPVGVALDSTGVLYIAGAQRIRMVSNGMISTVAGNGTGGFSGDNGPATSAQLYFPDAVAVDTSGNLYIADLYNRRIRKVSNGAITTVAGNGLVGDNGAAAGAQLSFPAGLTLDSANNLYVADEMSTRVREVSDGVITTVAGNGTVAFGDDNSPATSAQLSQPFGVAVDSAGDLYIADTGYSRVRKVSNGVITTVAGNGTAGFGGDGGPATSAQLYTPQGIAVDSAGNLYIADSGNGRIREVSDGVITTVAGNGTTGFSGDNGPATRAQLNGPTGVALDAAGNLYFSDRDNQRIRKISNGVITTVAGSGTAGFSGDSGPAASAQLSEPFGVALDSAGNLYVADLSNQRVRKVANGVISTVAGNGTPGFGGDKWPCGNCRIEPTPRCYCGLCRQGLHCRHV
jgi:sugar lactone lactonase YvrE